MVANGGRREERPAAVVGIREAPGGASDHGFEPAAASPAAVVQVQAWHPEEHRLPVVRVRDSWDLAPDFSSKDAAQANMLAQARTPQRLPPVGRQRSDGTLEWQRSDGSWVQRTRRPDGKWELNSGTERWVAPRECMDMCDLLELLHGAGAGVYPERGGYSVLEGQDLEAMTRAAIPMGANADRGGACGFLRAIGYPLAVHAAPGPRAAPRVRQAAQALEAFRGVQPKSGRPAERLPAAHRAARAGAD